MSEYYTKHCKPVCSCLIIYYRRNVTNIPTVQNVIGSIFRGTQLADAHKNLNWLQIFPLPTRSNHSAAFINTKQIFL